MPVDHAHFQERILADPSDDALRAVTPPDSRHAPPGRAPATEATAAVSSEQAGFAFE
jgi:hypothetical protein